MNANCPGLCIQSCWFRDGQVWVWVCRHQEFLVSSLDLWELLKKEMEMHSSVLGETVRMGEKRVWNCWKLLE